MLRESDKRRNIKNRRLIAICHGGYERNTEKTGVGKAGRKLRNGFITKREPANDHGHQQKDHRNGG